ncbi:MAG: response regulator [Chlamydiae bacterium]|nr:response regulator [Chlamydiota bacterium]
MESLRKTILVVDDEEGIRKSLDMILKEHYRVFTTPSAEQALQLLQTNLKNVDVIFSDILMCQMTGIQFLENVKKFCPTAQVILITGYPTIDTTVAALRLGASDYILKPFTVDEILKATRRALERKRTYQKNQEKIQELSEAIQRNYDGTIRALISAINIRDQYTAGHSYRVSKLMARFAKFLKIDSEIAEKLEIIGYLHDIGKIGIAQEILNKKSGLTSEEYEEIKLYPFIGYKILQSVDLLKDVLDILLYHQERFDGQGYPAGLRGREIPLGARMLAIVDAYDAMTSQRVYQEKQSSELSFKELREQGKSQFDPDLVESFIRMMETKGDSPIPVLQREVSSL